jgi:hypothetical protein
MNQLSNSVNLILHAWSNQVAKFQFFFLHRSSVLVLSDLQARLFVSSSDESVQMQ